MFKGFLKLCSVFTESALVKEKRAQTHREHVSTLPQQREGRTCLPACKLKTLRGRFKGGEECLHFPSQLKKLESQLLTVRTVLKHERLFMRDNDLPFNSQTKHRAFSEKPKPNTPQSWFLIVCLGCCTCVHLQTRTGQNQKTHPSCDSSDRCFYHVKTIKKGF